MQLKITRFGKYNYSKKKEKRITIIFFFLLFSTNLLLSLSSLSSIYDIKDRNSMQMLSFNIDNNNNTYFSSFVQENLCFLIFDVLKTELKYVSFTIKNYNNIFFLFPLFVSFIFDSHRRKKNIDHRLIPISIIIPISPLLSSINTFSNVPFILCRLAPSLICHEKKANLIINISINSEKSTIIHPLLSRPYNL